jgi:hypothetical protein
MGDTDTPRPRKRSAQGSVSSVLTPPTGLASIEDIQTSVTIPAQRAAETEASAPTAPPVAPPPAKAPPGVCVCGHAEEAHEHYRAGDDCGACGRDGCAHYRAADGRQAKKGLLSRVFSR